MRRILVALILVPALHVAAAPDAGLNLTFQLPAAVSGSTIDVTGAPYNATPGNDSDDDAVAINAAIAAASSGDEVYLPDGVYNTDTQIDGATGVSIRGQSESGTIIRSGFSATGGKTLKVPSASVDVTISNLSFDSDGSEPPRYVIEVGTNSGTLCQRVHIHDVTVKTFFERGIIGRTIRHLKVEDCTVSDATAVANGGEGYGVTIQQAGSDNNWVTGCDIDGPMIRHGILLQNSTHHNLIEYNTLDLNNEDAIDLHGEDEYSNEVRFNTITNGVKSAIGVGNTGSTHDKSGPDNWIHDNTITNCNDGVEIIEGTDDVFVEDNDIRFCTNYGIRVDNFVVSDTLANVSLTGNTILDCNRGILVDVEAPNLIVFDNIVTDNTSYGITTAAAVDDYSITFNDFSCNGTAANLGDLSGTYSDNEEAGSCNLPVELEGFMVE